MKTFIQVAFVVLLIAGPILILIFLKQPEVKKRSRYKFRLEVIGGFIALLTLLYTVLWNSVSETPGKTSSLDATMTSTPTVTITIFPTSTSTLAPTFTSMPPEATFTATPKPTSTPVPCLCASSTDYETITCLIHKESEAANQGSLELISRIFAPNAVIVQGDEDKKWNDPLSYYHSTFNAVKFSGAYHDDLKQVKVMGGTEYWVSMSGGKYTLGGVTYEILSTPNSDHWIFEKNQQGCWVVIRFEFNASHLTFPPE